MLTTLFLGKIKLKLFRKLLAVCVIVLAASLLGFLLETVWIALRHGYIDNRGMHLPLLLGYGLANLAVYLLLGAPGDPRFLPLLGRDRPDLTAFLLYFAEVFLLVSLGEAALGHLVHTFCHVEWWNYNSLPLHMGQYTSVPTSLGFSACVCIFLDRIYVPFLTRLTGIDLLQYADIILTLSFLAIADCIGALVYMARHHHPNIFFRLHLHSHAKENSLLQ